MSKNLFPFKKIVLTLILSTVIIALEVYVLVPSALSMSPPEDEAAGQGLPAGVKIIRFDEGVETDEGILRKLVFYTIGYKIDRKYNSMQGPYSMLDVSLLDPETPAELLWVKGVYSKVVDMEGESTVPQQLVCHVNVNYDAIKHNKMFKSIPSGSRIVTLSQGQYHTDMPEGFGLPIISNEPLKIDTMVLNHNLENPNLNVRHKVTITYYRDSELKVPMKALYQTSAEVSVLVKEDDSYLGVIDVPDDGRPTCHASAKKAKLVVDQFGRSIFGHWVVPPGRQINESLVTRNLRIPYDTTIHRIDVHLHPFAESLELKDVTTGKTVFKSNTKQLEGGIGLTHVDTYKSAKGIPVYKDHEYAMVSVYNNTTKENSDAMAVMYIHLLNKNFDRNAILARLEPMVGQSLIRD